MSKSLSAWDERPQELASLINPAFGALILNAAALGHIKETETGMPFIASFLVLPAILHKDTRVSLPRTLRTKMHSWVADHGEIRAGFSSRARSIVPYTREALFFGANQRLLTLDNDGRLYGKKVSTTKANWAGEDEPAVCMKKAEFLGRWLGDAGDLSGIFAMWGIQP